MYYAVAGDGVVLSIESTAQAALDTMSAISSLRFGRPNLLLRFVTNAKAFRAWSSGKTLHVDYSVQSDGRIVPIVV